MKTLLALTVPSALVVALVAAAPAGSAAPRTVTSADFPTTAEVRAVFPALRNAHREITPTGLLVRTAGCASAVPVKPRKSLSATYYSGDSDISVLVTVSQMKSTAQAKKYVSGARVMNRCARVSVPELELDLTSRTAASPKLGDERVGQVVDYGHQVRGLGHTFRKGARVIEVMTVHIDGKRAAKSRTAKVRKVAQRAYRLGL